MNHRWLIAAAGTLLQLLLGTVYAWSFFQKPLIARYEWSNAQVIGAFSLAICFLGLAAAWGGVNLPRLGPRTMAISGGLLFGTGYLLTAFALHQHSLVLLYFGYGVVGGIGLGLGYVTPVATVAKWFPDKKGLATGMVIMGFGFGALLMSKVLGPRLIEFFQGDFVKVFSAMGVGFAALSVLAASFLRNPPTPSSESTVPTEKTSAFEVVREVIRGRFLMLWIIFFCNILAGISIISFQSPLIQNLWKKIDADLSPELLAEYGATLIAVSSICNGVGRMFWGAISDRIGRVGTFRLMLGSQIVAFVLLSFVGDPRLFGLLICYILLCYGGGFGTMPAFILDVFGSRRMAVAYGAVLTAWSAAGITGPLLIAWLNDRYPHDTAKAASFAFYLSAGVLAVGLTLALFWSEGSRPKGSDAASTKS